MCSKNPDLLCFKLIVVSLVLSPSIPPEIRYFNAEELAKQTGTAWVIQNNFAIPAGGMRQFFVQPDALVPTAYLYAQARSAQTGESSFVLEPNALASMLFDCDPESTVEFAPIPGPVNLQVPIQKITIQNVRFADGPQGILGQVQGKWTGAIYIREFKTPNGRPYLFLGRNRVLVGASSRLKSHLEELKSQSRVAKIAETIALLKQDEAGYPPKELSGLL